MGIPVPREPFAFGGLSGSLSKYGDFDVTGEGAMEFFTNRRKVLCVFRADAAAAAAAAATAAETALTAAQSFVLSSTRSCWQSTPSRVEARVEQELKADAE